MLPPIIIGEHLHFIPLGTSSSLFDILITGSSTKSVSRSKISSIVERLFELRGYAFWLAY